MYTPLNVYRLEAMQIIIDYSIYTKAVDINKRLFVGLFVIKLPSGGSNLAIHLVTCHSISGYRRRGMDWNLN